MSNRGLHICADWVGGELAQPVGGVDGIGWGSSLSEGDGGMLNEGGMMISTNSSS